MPGRRMSAGSGVRRACGALSDLWSTGTKARLVHRGRSRSIEGGRSIHVAFWGDTWRWCGYAGAPVRKLHPEGSIPQAHGAVHLSLCKGSSRDTGPEAGIEL